MGHGNHSNYQVSSPLLCRGQAESDKEQREGHGRRQRDREHRVRDEERKRQRHHDFDKFTRRKDETKWGKGYCQERAKKDAHGHHAYAYCGPDAAADKLGNQERDDMASRKERIRNKVSENADGCLRDLSRLSSIP